MTAMTSNLERDYLCLLLAQYCDNFQLIVTVVVLIIAINYLTNNLNHFSACMYPCIIAKQGLYNSNCMNY